ncbi:ABC-F family ATP-binding cassette domain-containing protein [Cyclobacteriaceae bacterium]|nr:ABC-F family ATP-binding cassette domain-containing protein [Cyclobacteriaceae bacterium]MDC1234119.1 ABC-F family ATP-binding cassette domain-containing protein [Cyclobacteriaceae bacterium]MDC1516137.1 ABC-F family ATP-binding cassette domain-containing protein [Cyclobacteriaceae bacterium]
MNYLSVERLTKSFDEKQLFEEITFGLEQGQKAALVGVNGCGKSTLLKVIAGLLHPNSGEVTFRKGISLSILTQNPEFADEDTVMQAVFSKDREELKAIRDYESALLKMEKNPESEVDLSPFIEQMDALNAWDYEHQVKEILGKLGIHTLDQKMGELSGGQKKRVALAQCLVVKPHVLILDEPTNHLDLEIIEWLEEYLATQNLTLLMVTHDRYFLDRVTNEILEIDAGQIFKYHGNYSDFLQQKSEREEQQAVTVGKAKNLLKKELEWMRRQPKARGTKAKYRIDAFYDVKEKASQTVTKSEMEVNLKSDRQGKKIMEIKHISKIFDEKKVIDDFSYVFQRKERIGIVGANGAGKSTFLNILTQNLTPDLGELDIGQTTKFGYYTQDEAVFDPQMKVIEVVKEVAEFIQLADGSEVSASNLLTQFLFLPSVQYNLVGKLSGGEKRRLQLLRVLMANPNFLVLDEPTNDLDIMTLNVLEDYLDKFDGCLMIVSHDRYFMDKLVDHLFVFEGQGLIRDFPGNYTDYRATEGGIKSVKNEGQKPSNTKKNISKEAVESPRKMTFNEKRELEQIEKELSKLENQKKAIEGALAEETDYEKLMALGIQLDQIKTHAEDKELRWLELSELDTL